MIGTNTLKVADAGVRESGRMDRLLDKEFKTPAGERVIVQSKTLTARDPGFQAVIADVIKRFRRIRRSRTSNRRSKTPASSRRMATRC